MSFAKHKIAIWIFQNLETIGHISNIFAIIYLLIFICIYTSVSSVDQRECCTFTRYHLLWYKDPFIRNPYSIILYISVAYKTRIISESIIFILTIHSFIKVLFWWSFIINKNNIIHRWTWIKYNHLQNTFIL